MERYELRSTQRIATLFLTVASGRLIRNPQVHVPPSLTATCQLQELSLKAERNTYIWPSCARQETEITVTRATAIEESRLSMLPRKHFLESTLRKHRNLG